MALEDREWEKAKDYFDQVLNMDSRNAEAYLGLAMAEQKLPKRDAFEDAYSSLSNDVLREARNVQRAIQFGNETFRQWIRTLDQRREKERERIVKEKGERMLAQYELADEMVRKRKSSADLFQAAEIYRDLGTYLDSGTLYSKVSSEAKTLEKKEQYEEARRLMNSTNLSGLEHAEMLLSKQEDEEDSQKLLAECRKRIQIIREKTSTYNKALMKLDSVSYNDLKDAAALLRSIPDWKDSNIKLENCLSRIRRLDEQAQPLIIQREKLSKALAGENGRISSKQKQLIIAQLTEIDIKIKNIIK